VVQVIVQRSIVLAVLVALSAPAAAAAAPLTERDVRSILTLQDPRISPDGSRIALVVRRPDYVKNVYKNELVLVDVKSGAARTLVRDRDDVSAPRWSPSGDRLAFVATPEKRADAKDEPHAEIMVLSLDGGEPRAITATKKGIDAYAWRPDGRGFAYLTADPSPDEKRIAAKDDWFEVGDGPWTAKSEPSSSHLWTIDAAGKHARRITHGTWSLTGEPSFTPDGNTVYAVRTPTAATNRYRSRAIVAIGLAHGNVRALTAGRTSADAPLVAPDGRSVVYGAEHPAAFSQTDLYATSLDGRNPRDVSVRLDRSVQFGAFVPDGIVVGANDATRDRLFKLARDGTVRALPLADVNVSGNASAARDGTLAFIGVTASRPSELYVLSPKATVPRRLTAYNAAATARALGHTRAVGWRSTDGFALNGVLTEPVGAVAGRQYPLVVLIHGGPTATSTDAFSPLAQLMAARGWLVFQPNYRGSDNLGHRFAQATVPYITSSPARDVLAGVDAVERMGIVDRSRIGVSGWSEGGLLTSWLIGHDHRWRAAMSGAAVNDWTGYADMTDAKDFTPSYIGGSPWSGAKMRALYDAESPLTYAAAVTTPTLIMTDAGDFRVPTPVSYEFYHAIRATGTPVELVIIPVNGHNPSDPLHREERTHRWVEWFARQFSTPR
jgi:dipeptidyl aminopeptidase/acylaminoacyl peptidase